MHPAPPGPGDVPEDRETQVVIDFELHECGSVGRGAVGDQGEWGRNLMVIPRGDMSSRKFATCLSFVWMGVSFNLDPSSNGWGGHAHPPLAWQRPFVAPKGWRRARSAFCWIPRFADGVPGRFGWHAQSKGRQMEEDPFSTVP